VKIGDFSPQDKNRRVLLYPVESCSRAENSSSGAGD
jgi:hypothetical protein